MHVLRELIDRLYLTFQGVSSVEAETRGPLKTIHTCILPHRCFVCTTALQSKTLV